MKNIDIAGTARSPGLRFNYDKGEIEIYGRSLPENTTDVYKPAFDWLNEYINNPKPQTKVKVSLEYFNTSSSKYIIEFFRKFRELYEKGNDLKVEWYYEEDDPELKSEGEMFRTITKIPMDIIPVKEFDFYFY